MTKVCSHCHIEQPIESYGYGKGYKNGIRSWCKSCHSRYSMRPPAVENRRRRKQEIKALVINHYGGRCACCGETNTMFLTIDHINGGRGGESQTKRGVSGGSQTYYRLIKHNYPADVQVLCFNCNCGRNINNGICPHKEG